ncbi:MAG: DUF4035 domain-containing protein [Dehalococcoidales bacterium]|nr:DUF4035 domain-containing protein [Dehalococcoidales bacterium]
MLPELTEEQLAEWEEFNRLEPIGSYKMDYHFAHLCNLLFNIAQGFAGGQKRAVAKLLDFMPHWYTQYGPGIPAPVKRQSLDEMKKVILSIAGKSKGKK